jgi:excisionase family DNA binding protein
MDVLISAGNVGTWAGEPMMRESEAAQRLGLSKRTLQKWRVTGGGPDFLKLGRSVRYSVKSLERWLARSRRRSTSERSM